MAPYDAQATRRRLLDAAYAEFAQYGIAGARVERIGEAADSNKAQIYHYFGGKTQLFDAVCEQAIQRMEAEVPFDPYDLPGYAARLVRLHERRPRSCACALGSAWNAPLRAQPVRLRVRPRPDRRDRPSPKIGVLPAHFHPGFLLGLVLHLATGWVSSAPNSRPPSTSPPPKNAPATSRTPSAPCSARPAPA